ncbi:MAG: alpha/beta fold hydrolase [Clostridia bacterium]|nr:alpha/beta fold hydrolase [Clostridia bacterium]
MFKKWIERSYRKMLFTRIDDTGTVRYFSANDFEGLQSRAFDFRAKAGHLLRGSFYFYEGRETDRVVVFDHGMGCGHRPYMKEIEMLARHGYTVFSYDHTGCANSEGVGMGGFATSPADLDACLAALKAERPMGESRYSVMGHSWGGFSTMNIAALHPDVCHLVALSGPISTQAMIDQFMGKAPGFLRRHVMSLERVANPGYAELDARTSLAAAEMPILLIYSDDDKTVSYKKHFLPLAEALGTKENVTLVTLTGKDHNPNYTTAAVAKKAEMFNTRARLLKKGRLNTDEAKKAFVARWDWHAITEQDPAVWEQIFAFLDK